MSESDKDERWAKLPKWAQDEYGRALRARMYAEKRLADIMTEPSSNAGAIYHTNFLSRRAIPKGDSVRFHLNDQEDWTEASIRSGKLHVMGSRPISVEPRASNVVDIEVLS